jgi:Holliday junction resolvasome RuvABC DNA-binding subunit
MIIGSFVVASDFVITKKKKKISKTKLQEQCCQQAHRHMELIPQINKKMADIQLVELEQVIEYVEGESSVFKNASKQQLHEQHKNAQELTEALEGVLDALQKYHQIVQKPS